MTNLSIFDPLDLGSEFQDPGIYIPHSGSRYQDSGVKKHWLRIRNTATAVNNDLEKRAEEEYGTGLSRTLY